MTPSSGRLLRMLRPIARTRRLASWAACAAAYYSTLSRFVSPLARRRGRAAPILLYHRIFPDGEAPRGAVTRSDFRAQLRHLVRHYTVLPLDELTAMLAVAEPLPPRAVAVTFDDSYASTYSEAFPAIVETRCPVTVFLNTAPVGTGEVLWWDRLVRALRATTRTRDAVAAIVRRGGLSAPDFDDPHFESVMVEIRGRPEGEVQRVVAELTAALGEPTVGPNAADLMMGWDEVRTMAASGLVAFGAHTVTHRNLTRAAPDELRWELAESRAAIERATGRPVPFFAYPYGRWGADYNDAVRDAVAAAGYDAAFTVDSAMAELGDHPFAIPRISECADRWRGPGGTFSAALFDAYLTGVRGEYEALPAGIRGAGRAAPPPARPRTEAGDVDAPAPPGGRGGI